MARRYFVRKRQNYVLYFEALVTSGLLSFFLYRYIEHHWSISIITFGVSLVLFLYAFFQSTIFRYVVTVLFSMVYGIIGFYIGKSLDETDFTAAVVFAFLAYFISIIAHIDHFYFLKDAKLIEYEKHNY